MNDDKIYLLTGSNVGHREKNLSTALTLINETCGLITQASAMYETAAWGKTDQPAFLNQALELSTPLTARQLMRQLLQLEKTMGRERQEKFGPRLIDMDILFYKNEIKHYKYLTLPHPALPYRRFALLPLASIAPHKIHPVLQKDITTLLQECTDMLPVKKYS
ncbi:MAG: 2-amino-4-hydroxy-6-hydroxymethyldihydropteridine diphosphokinase [Chitinophagaceae bacterium]|nr:2-amino-4-hydroxy-6-hydroxymethyldihydropteridine diphosphokinase [Chitinophagaceae bacterium]MCB0740210.1 2-amino-4-hydroxy-6-hydroxymethyldihydropteridine diphosphokinase [Chitinophagaceae bacterium]HQV05953.1 2-amino-4-hydroxy-6-hydroxymethyldihydropteridine diphosphokinase [Chitinophagaceae bacterium]